MFKSPFEEKKDLIVVSDMFVQQYVGGAEMTLEAFLNSVSSNYKIHKINCRDLTFEVFTQILNKFSNAKWLFGNIGNIDANILNSAIFQIKDYDIIECDYKYCSYRSEELHKEKTSNECDCANNEKLYYLISNFYSNAKNLFWMSKKQMQITNKRLRIVNVNQIVLGSLFDIEHINYIKSLTDKTDVKRSSKYIVLKSPSWVKGYNNSIDYCVENKLDYEEVWNLDYKSLLNKLRSSKGLVYLPNGKDTCPRLVIEAKLLGCDLILNDKVQHKDDDWFKNVNSIYDYQEKQRKMIKELF
jgi:hypothetical protein